MKGKISFHIQLPSYEEPVTGVRFATHCHPKLLEMSSECNKLPGILSQLLVVVVSQGTTLRQGRMLLQALTLAWLESVGGQGLLQKRVKWDRAESKSTLVLICWQFCQALKHVGDFSHAWTGGWLVSITTAVISVTSVSHFLGTFPLTLDSCQLFISSGVSKTSGEHLATCWPTLLALGRMMGTVRITLALPA